MAAAMVIPMGTASAFAANEPSNSTDVKYEVTQGYEWRIHSEIDFGKDAGVKTTVEKGENNTVSVTKNIIPDGQKLNITVTGTDGGAFTIKNGNTTLNYDVNNGGEQNLSVGDSVLAVPAGTNSGSVNMKFTLHTTTETSEVAGKYVGKVVYNAAIVANN